MSIVKVQFKITDEAQQAYAMRTGRVVANTDVVLLNLDQLTPEERAVVIPVIGLPYSESSVNDLQYAPIKLTSIPETGADWVAVANQLQAARDASKAEAAAKKAAEIAEYTSKANNRLAALEAMDDAELYHTVNGRLGGWGIHTQSSLLTEENLARKEALKARLAAYEPHRIEQEKVAAERAAVIRAEREAKEEEERASIDAERSAWISEHGSDFLKKAVNAGYDCQRRYVIERAEVEHPGAVVDFEDAAEWKSRSCPSEEALDRALKIGGTVVWLTKPPKAVRNQDDYYDDFENCEAVVLREYLGKYDLVWY